MPVGSLPNTYFLCKVITALHLGTLGSTSA